MPAPGFASSDSVPSRPRRPSPCQQSVDPLLYLRQWRYGASHGVDLLSGPVRTSGKPTPPRTRSQLFTKLWDAVHGEPHDCFGLQAAAGPSTKPLVVTAACGQSQQPAPRCPLSKSDRAPRRRCGSIGTTASSPLRSRAPGPGRKCGPGGSQTHSKTCCPACFRAPEPHHVPRLSVA